MSARLCLWCSPPERRGSPCDCRLCLSYRAGLSLLKIATIECASVTRVRNLLHEHETPLRARGYPKGLARKVSAAAGRGLPIGGAQQPKPPTAQVEAATFESRIPSELLTQTLQIDSLHTYPPSGTDTITLGTRFIGEDGRAYRVVLHRVTEDGRLVWRGKFERVGREVHP